MASNRIRRDENTLETGREIEAVSSVLDSNCIVLTDYIVDLPVSIPPPAQAQEARPVRAVRLRPVRFERALSGVWGGVRRADGGIRVLSASGRMRPAM